MEQAENDSVADYDKLLRDADSRYTGFPKFSDWATLHVNTARWERHAASLEKYRDQKDDVRRKAIDIVRRVAAIETGAVEGLYEVDRGFTFTVAAESAMWESVLGGKGEKAKSLIEAQLSAYELLIDMATENQAVSEAIIRRLHEEICKNQDTYSVHTALGIQEIQLPKGKYKDNRNHIRKQNGSFHEYCPVDLTPEEMHRFCKELESTDFKEAHPILQAAFAHYAFVVIHPFSDGNGRVARALGSIFLYRAYKIPMLVMSDNRKLYRDALEFADSGNAQFFIDFVLERGIDAIRLVGESIEAASHQNPKDLFSAIQTLYTTKGGYTHTEVDNAGKMLIEQFSTEIQKQIKDLQSQDVRVLMSRSNPQQSSSSTYLRLLLNPNDSEVHIGLMSNPPLNRQISYTFQLEVPKDCDREDEFVIRRIGQGSNFEARITEIIPQVSTALLMRMSIFIERTIAQGLEELKAEMEELRLKNSSSM